jgi:hypothetical protein
MDKVTFDDVIQAARQLKSENNENPEYDRALRDMIVELFGGSMGFDSDNNRMIAEAMIGVR